MEKLINNEMLIEALEIYENNRLNGYTVSDFTPSKKFERKMEKLIKSEKNYYYKVTLTKARKTFVILAAAIALGDERYRDKREHTGFLYFKRK